jgi:hypothetical protein
MLNEIFYYLFSHDILRYAFSVIVGLMFVASIVLAVLGLVYFFADRKTVKEFKEWRGKK